MLSPNVKPLILKVKLDMRFQLPIFLILLISLACTRSGNNEAIQTSLDLKIPIQKHEVFQKWASYYQQFDPDFSWENFNKKETDSLQILPGSVLPVWHPDFKSYYRPLLIYSPDSSHYIDIDSYLWFVIDENASDPEIGYSPDQEINLINFNDSTVNRIAFRGPNQRVEEALWLDKQTISLLENNENGIPMISIIKIEQQMVNYYEYPDSVTTTSGYWQKRIEKAIDMLPKYLSAL